MKQGTANLAEDYCFIHKALRPVSKARRQIAAVPPSNLRPDITWPVKKQYFMYVAVPEIELSDSVSLSVTAQRYSRYSLLQVTAILLCNV